MVNWRLQIARGLFAESKGHYEFFSPSKASRFDRLADMFRTGILCATMLWRLSSAVQA